MVARRRDRVSLRGEPGRLYSPEGVPPEVWHVPAAVTVQAPHLGVPWQRSEPVTRRLPPYLQAIFAERQRARRSRVLDSWIAGSWRDAAMARHCAARKQRKQVLFAKRIAGKGGGRHGPYRRTLFSQYGC